MRKLWLRRRGVSTMIGGIIFLVIFLAALVFMLTIGQQYDAYFSTAAAMQQRQIDMYSENLLAAYPGVANGLGIAYPHDPPPPPLSFQVANCGSAGVMCNNYTLTLNNLGISAQIVRMYINSASVCNACVLGPSPTAAPFTFRASDQMVNSGESSHFVVFWLPANVFLSSCSNNSPCEVSVVTSRGRTFSFLWPFPTVPQPAGAQSGGTGIYIGPLVITFQKELITYTTDKQTLPQIPLGGQNGYWALPGQVSKSSGIIIYIKIQTDVGVTHDVYLTPQAVFEIAQFTSPGVINAFFVVAPISHDFCEKFHNATYNSDIDCDLATYKSSGPHNTGGIPGNVVAYAACGATPLKYNTTCQARYIIPKPIDPQSHERGPPVIVAFAVAGASQGSNNLQTIQWKSVAATSFLGLSYVYDNGTGPYLYGVTLPFIALCIADANPPVKYCSI